MKPQVPQDYLELGASSHEIDAHTPGTGPVYACGSVRVSHLSMGEGLEEAEGLCLCQVKVEGARAVVRRLEQRLEHLLSQGYHRVVHRDPHLRTHTLGCRHCYESSLLDFSEIGHLSYSCKSHHTITWCRSTYRVSSDVCRHAEYAGTDASQTDLSRPSGSVPWSCPCFLLQVHGSRGDGRQWS